MIFVTAQPNEILFSWQTEVQLYNFQSLGIDLSQVHILVGYNTFEKLTLVDRWDRIAQKYPAVNFHYYVDNRLSKRYAPSIRPYLLGLFFKEHSKYEEEYMFYCDSDIVLSEVPAFEAMTDGRWHLSKADYISWDYIEEKKSNILKKHMLNSVGIDQQTVAEKGKNVGGVQYYIYGTTYEFWNKVEQDCERMWSGFHDNFGLISKEYQEAFGRPMTGNDFQIWCTDMWCIYWNALLYGVEVYVNPELHFVWPQDKIEQLDRHNIYHDSGNQTAVRDKWFDKTQYKTKTPFYEDLSKLGYFDNGEAGAQRFYLDLIEKVAEQYKKNDEISTDSYPLVSCVMTTYGRFECVERSIAYWLLQDYPNKELVIFNTAEKALELDERLRQKGIRIINQSTIIGTDTEYTNVGQVRADAIKVALGEYYVCWDDDDKYLPWHLSQGMNYILSNNRKAYKPSQSFWSQDGGLTYSYAKNSMEASCIVKLSEIKKYGFNNSNGAEHLAWMRPMVDEGELDENYSVTPYESYAYIWGEEIASHKQSGHIDDPNNFENHKKKSIDFGVRPLSLYSPLRIKLDFERIAKFVANSEFDNKIAQYI